MNESAKTAETPRQRPLGRLFRNLALVVLALACLIWFGFWIAYRWTHAVTNSAFVDSDLVNVAPLVPGHIVEVTAKEGQAVRKGEVLALIDDRDIRAELAVRQAQVACAEQALERARLTAERVQGEVVQGIAVARQDVVQADASVASAGNALSISKTQAEESLRAAKAGLMAAQADLDAVEKDYVRLETLYGRGSLEKRRLDLVTAQREGARAKVELARTEVARAETARNQVAISENQVRQAEAARTKSQAGLSLSLVKEKSAEEAVNAIHELEAQVEAARRAVEAAALKLEHTRIVSPMNGILAKKFVNPGDFVSPGYPMFAVYDRENVYVSANLEETKLPGVRLGATVDVEVDAIPGQAFTGRVVEIGEAAGARFALIPRDNSAGEFTKVVQRIPIKILVTPVAGKRLLPGMSAYVGIRTSG